MSAVRQLRPSSDDSSLDELAEIIRTRSFRKGAFRLASGVESSRYFNLKPTMMTPRGALLTARAFLDHIHAEGVEFVGGLEMGAVPIIGALAAVGEVEGRPIRTFFVRKAPKAHGTREIVEGLGPNEELQGHRVMVLDDVATTGGSILKAIDAAREAGAVVATALVLVDREEGATENLAEHGVRLLSVFRASAFD